MNKKTLTRVSFILLGVLVTCTAILFLLLDQGAEAGYEIAAKDERCFSGGISGKSATYARIERLPLWNRISVKPVAEEHKRCRFFKNVTTRIISRSVTYPNTPQTKTEIRKMAEELERTGWAEAISGSAERCVFSKGDLGINIELGNQGWDVYVSTWEYSGPGDKPDRLTRSCIRPNAPF